MPTLGRGNVRRKPREQENLNKVNKINKAHTLRMFLGMFLLSGLCIFGHDNLDDVAGPATVHYQKFFTMYPQFVVGHTNNIEYISTLQITNKNRESYWYGRIRIHGTGAKRWTADYTINGQDYSGYDTSAIGIVPNGTRTLVYKSSGATQVGFLKIAGAGSRGEKQDISTSFFFQIRNTETGELIDSVGVAPSDFGWNFAIPVSYSQSKGVNTGIAYAYVPVVDVTQLVFELRAADGERADITYVFIDYISGTGADAAGLVFPYHRAQFLTEIFPDIFKTLHEFEGSLRIYAQRNINVLALRTDTRHDGNIQLTSVPTSGELCIDGPRDLLPGELYRMEDYNCFQRDIYLDLGWVPVR